MGMDADAYVMFGFVLSEDEVEAIRADEDDFDWEDWYAEKVGLPHPPGEYSELRRPEFRTYWGKKRALIEASGVQVEYVGWCDEPQMIVSASTVRSSYGEIEELDTQVFANEYPAERLRKWCEATGVTYREPKWLLASYLSC